MARILDTIPDFVDLAQAAFLQDRMTRRFLWEERYRDRHPKVFEAFFSGYGDPEQVPAVTHKLSDVRKTVEEAAPVMPGLIDEVEPALRDALGVDDVPDPLHVLMVGTFSANAFVTRVDGDVAVLHCLEWFGEPGTAKVLVAHEDTHALHESLLGARPPEDPAWTAFAEGVAIQASRAVVPDRPEDDYFWYGVAGFEDWLPWCSEHRDALLQRFGTALDEEGATEAFFGGGMVEGRWRVGFYLADELVGGLGMQLPELVRMSVDEGRAAIRDSLGAGGS